MTRLLAAAAPTLPLWNSLGTSLRQTLRSLTSPAAGAASVDSEQARIRQSSRLWLVG